MIKTYPVIGNNGQTKRKVKAVWTGEKRPVKAGEWYLSGAIPEAYQAFGNIADICRSSLWRELRKVRQS